MITLLASIGGFISSIIPEIIKLFIDKNDKKHELEILKHQIQVKEKGLDSRLHEIEIAHSLLESKALYGTYKTDIIWIDALNGTVRPVLAYSFFFIYCFAKIMQYQIMINVSFADFTILWNEEDQAIFAGIISFYYGQRALAKLKRK